MNPFPSFYCAKGSVPSSLTPNNPKSRHLRRKVCYPKWSEWSTKERLIILYKQNNSAHIMKLEVAPNCSFSPQATSQAWCREETGFLPRKLLSACDESLPYVRLRWNDCQPNRQYVKLYLRTGAFGFGNRKQFFFCL